MNFRIYTYTSLAILVALTIGIVTPTTTTEIIRTSYAQSTGDFPTSPDSTPDSSSSASDGDNFQQFMSCMFGGDASEEDIASALDGSGDQPTEQEIRDCFAPLYNTGGASGATTTGGSGSTDDSGSTGGDSDGTEQSSEDQDEESGNDDESSEP
ncbi:MAG TPA: hypothetical protein VIX38_00785 [Nitrososphaeraceae archaeon]